MSDHESWIDLAAGLGLLMLGRDGDLAVRLKKAMERYEITRKPEPESDDGIEHVTAVAIVKLAANEANTKHVLWLSNYWNRLSGGKEKP